MALLISSCSLPSPSWNYKVFSRVMNCYHSVCALDSERFSLVFNTRIPFKRTSSENYLSMLSVVMGFLSHVVHLWSVSDHIPEVGITCVWNLDFPYQKAFQSVANLRGELAMSCLLSSAGSEVEVVQWSGLSAAFSVHHILVSRVFLRI
jgi:hypothetical protein